jgi:translation initiation factor 2 subunit 2
MDVCSSQKNKALLGLADMFFLENQRLEFDYEEMLKRARSQIPEISSKHERLELPKLRFSVVGMRTIVYNFKEIADTLSRNPQHLLKYLTREMATAATTQESRVIFQGKFSQDTLERLIQRYMETFVICPVCKLPDTKIMKEKRLSFLVCEACGARSSIPQL